MESSSNELNAIIDKTSTSSERKAFSDEHGIEQAALKGLSQVSPVLDGVVISVETVFFHCVLIFYYLHNSVIYFMLYFADFFVLLCISL